MHSSRRSACLVLAWVAAAMALVIGTGCTTSPPRSGASSTRAGIATAGREGVRRIGESVVSGPLTIKLQGAVTYTTETGPGPGHYKLHYLLATDVLIHNSSDSTVQALPGADPFTLATSAGQARPLWDVPSPGGPPSAAAGQTRRYIFKYLGPRRTEAFRLEFAVKTADKGWKLTYGSDGHQQGVWSMSSSETVGQSIGLQRVP